MHLKDHKLLFLTNSFSNLLVCYYYLDNILTLWVRKIGYTLRQDFYYLRTVLHLYFGLQGDFIKIGKIWLIWPLCVIKIHLKDHKLLFLTNSFSNLLVIITWIIFWLSLWVCKIGYTLRQDFCYLRTVLHLYFSLQGDFIKIGKIWLIWPSCVRKVHLKNHKLLLLTNSFWNLLVCYYLDNILAMWVRKIEYTLRQDFYFIHTAIRLNCMKNN